MSRPEDFWWAMREGGAFYDVAGWLVWLLVGHLAGDWLFQPHPMALKKTSDPFVRAVHCSIWTGCVLLGPVLVADQLRSTLATFNAPLETTLATSWLWLTHFWIDSYKPLMWFRRHVSQDPFAHDAETFKEQFNTPRGFVVYVTLDQIFHLLTLVPVAFWLAWRAL